jgi:hypothetical protein
VKCEHYEGVPDYADLILKRLESFGVEQFGNYQPFELCNLEYESARQSQIEVRILWRYGKWTFYNTDFW